ncbi:membrane protein [Thermococcus sp. EP1]|uniref:hypothetical protein n=1 Tax=Thermococcus sp. EP1 TaxID=1591054 RepID=UPI0006DA89AF|nr:hypothetical protein [Thermococcus sp. EP1]KPU62883.1 membrane protein [Thermococcus sp. EP1]
MADVEMAKTLIKVGGILSFIEPFLIAFMLLLTVIGVLFAVPFAILGFWIYNRANECIELIENGEYKKAKDKLLIPAIIALILTSRVGGILMLLGLVLLPSEESTSTF